MHSYKMSSAAQPNTRTHGTRNSVPRGVFEVNLKCRVNEAEAVSLFCKSFRPPSRMISDSLEFKNKRETEQKKVRERDSNPVRYAKTPAEIGRFSAKQRHDSYAR